MSVLCTSTNQSMDKANCLNESQCGCFLSALLLTLSLDFVRAPSPDNSPCLEFYLKCPPLGPLWLFGIKQCKYCAELQVSVEVVHLCVVVHPQSGSVGKEAQGPSHVHFPCLLSVSSQNNLLSPGLDRDTYSRRRRGKPVKQQFSRGLQSVFSTENMWLLQHHATQQNKRHRTADMVCQYCANAN